MNEENTEDLTAEFHRQLKTNADERIKQERLAEEDRAWAAAQDQSPNRKCFCGSGSPWWACQVNSSDCW